MSFFGFVLAGVLIIIDIAYSPSMQKYGVMLQSVTVTFLIIVVYYIFLIRKRKYENRDMNGQ